MLGFNLRTSDRFTKEYLLPGDTDAGENGVPNKELQSGDMAGVSLYPIHDSVRLLDANLIFQPLLCALGVMPQQLRFTTITDSSELFNFQWRTFEFLLCLFVLGDGNDVTTLDALGSNLSLVGNMDTIRIDIVVSEHGKSERKKGKGKHRRAHVDINTGM